MNLKKVMLFFFIILLFSFISAITGYVVEQGFSSNVSIEGLRIIYQTFNGSTTNFNNLSTEQLNNLSNAVLEKTTYGKVSFNQNLNLTAIAGSDRIVNFDADLNISHNLIYIDNSNLPYMNKIATLTIRRLTFSNPQIMKGGAVCSDCVLISYSGGNLTFTTQTFYGAYYARETPTTLCGNGVCESGETPSNCAADCGGSGGGGGGGGGGGESINKTIIPSPVGITGYDFKVVPVFFTVQMSKGQYYQKNLLIINNGTKELNISVFVYGLETFIFPEENAIINLLPGQNKTLRLNIYVSETKPADVYVGKILFRSRYVERELKSILDIKEKNALFDIKTNVIKKYISPGGKVRANISIVNLGDLRNFDVSLEYMIIDFDKNNYTVKKEDFAMNQTYNNMFYLEVPKNIRMGDYLFYSRVSSGNVSASSYDSFVVEKISLLIWFIIILIVLIIIVLLFFRLRRKKEPEKQVVRRVIKTPLIKRKIKAPKLP